MVGIEVQMEEKWGSYENGETTQKAWGGAWGRAWEEEQMRGKWMLLPVGRQGTRKSGFYFIFELRNHSPTTNLVTSTMSQALCLFLNGDISVI